MAKAPNKSKPVKQATGSKAQMTPEQKRAARNQRESNEFRRGQGKK